MSSNRDEVYRFIEIASFFADWFPILQYEVLSLSANTILTMAVTFPDVPSGEDLMVSATAYLTWLRCPERALARFEGHYGEGSVATFRGIVAHRVFARHLMDGPIEDVDFRQVCREEIGKGLNPSLAALGLKPSQLDALVEEVRVLYASFVRLPVDGLRHVELQLMEEAAPGLQLRGVIDAVFDEVDGRGIRLTDWKTGRLDDADHQLAFYALLWAVHSDEIPQRVEAISVASGERHEETPNSATVAVTAQRVATMVGEVRVAMSERRRLERTAGPWCWSCPLLEACEEGAAATAVLGA